MPTTHPRLALTCDPDLDAALRRGAELLGDGRPTAAVARELILRGARELASESDSELDRWLSERGATEASRSTADVVALASKLGAPDGTSLRALTDALEEQRGERF